MRRVWIWGLALFLTACGGGGGGGSSNPSPSSPPPPPAARTLSISVQPSGASAGTAFTTQPVVHVQTAQGALDASDNTTFVSVAIVSGSGAQGATLTGTTSVTAVGGVASFTNLTLDSAGSGYRLRFTATSLSAIESVSFDVAAAPASQITFQIDSQQDVRPISRFIYGMNFAFDGNRPANLTLSRSGGNRMTAYNWETNASNAGSDWFHQNDDFLGGGNVPGAAVTPLVERARCGCGRHRHGTDDWPRGGGQEWRR